jgi:protein phosphatase
MDLSPDTLSIIAAAAAFVAVLSVVRLIQRATASARSRAAVSAPTRSQESADSKPKMGVDDEEDQGGVPVKSDIRDITGLPRISYEEDADADPTLVGASAAPPAPTSTHKIVYDPEAEPEEPTQASAVILVSATGQTDRGIKRKRNEDNLLVLKEPHLFVVADGMGGYNGGDIASKLAVDTIATAFQKHEFEGKDHDGIPKRASELARAVQMANDAIYLKAQKQPELEGMGTTLCAARFSSTKQRLYIAHVGDSRVYRFRRGALKQMTADHTMRDLGVPGESATHLSRAVGIWPRVPIDIVLGKPLPDDVYLLCSDGLSKMVPDQELAKVLANNKPQEAVDKLIAAANAHGGMDNITVIVVKVEPVKKTRAA